VLTARGIVKKRNGLVKVLANGELKSAVTVHAHKFSKGAQKAIEAAGGRAVVIGASNSEAAPAA
jgi:large subunit ribosomal protein L15